MSAALGLKVRTVVSLHLWDLFVGPRPGRARQRGSPPHLLPHDLPLSGGTAGVLMRMDVRSGYRAPSPAVKVSTAGPKMPDRAMRAAQKDTLAPWAIRMCRTVSPGVSGLALAHRVPSLLTRWPAPGRGATG